MSERPVWKRKSGCLKYRFLYHVYFALVREKKRCNERDFLVNRLSQLKCLKLEVGQNRILSETSFTKEKEEIRIKVLT